MHKLTSLSLALFFSAVSAAEPEVTDVPKVPKVTKATEVSKKASEVKADEKEKIDPNQKLREKMEKLSLEQQLKAAELEKELAIARQQITKIQTALDLRNIKHQEKMVQIKEEQEMIALKAGFEEEKRKEKNKKVQIEIEEITQSIARKRAELDKELFEANAEKERAASKIAQQLEIVNQAEAGLRVENFKREKEISDKQHELNLFGLEMTKKQNELAVLQNQIQEMELAEKIRDQVAPIEAGEKAIVDGTLVITDRRISLNGPIFEGVADYITDRIHFYNNVSTKKPIYIVIDRCPGGSVMEGYRILKAMESSQAPIHVVVKSFAASMAAVITTLSEHSYAYPNAVLLHHQMSTGRRGNLTQLKEELETARKWEKKLMVPLAKKMGLTLEEFRAKMYENNSDGDWEEFAEDAVKLKWVNNIVNKLREVGITKKPTEEISMSDFWMIHGLKEEVDAQGKPFMKLPALKPYDCYFIHNTNNYYR